MSFESQHLNQNTVLVAFQCHSQQWFRLLIVIQIETFNVRQCIMFRDDDDDRFPNTFEPWFESIRSVSWLPYFQLLHVPSLDFFVPPFPAHFVINLHPLLLSLHPYVHDSPAVESLSGFRPNQDLWIVSPIHSDSQLIIWYPNSFRRSPGVIDRTEASQKRSRHGAMWRMAL